MWLATDDGPRKLRAIWLGPRGATLPFAWTYVQWGVCLVAIPVGAGMLFGLLTLMRLLGERLPSGVGVIAALIWLVLGMTLIGRAMIRGEKLLWPLAGVLAGLFLIAGLQFDMFTAAVFGSVWGAPAGVYASVMIMRKVTYDEPLRYQVNVVRTEYRLSGRSRDRHAKPESDQNWSFPQIQYDYLAEPTLQCMRWSETHQRERN